MSLAQGAIRHLDERHPIIADLLEAMYANSVHHDTVRLRSCGAPLTENPPDFGEPSMFMNVSRETRLSFACGRFVRRLRRRL